MHIVASRYFSFLGLMGAGIIGLSTYSMPVHANAVCGPGDHWVDTCSAGTDVFRSWYKFGIDVNFFDGNLDGQPDANVMFYDPTTTVVRQNPIATDPLNLTHLNQIKTEITKSEATGPDPFNPANLDWVLRIGTLAGVAQPSSGLITETPTNSYLADSFFDIFMEIDIPGFGTLHNIDPFRVGAVIDRAPTIRLPGTPPLLTNIYEPAPSILPFWLYDENDQHVANITLLLDGTDPHHMVPEPSVLLLLGAGFAIMGLGHRRRSTQQGDISAYLNM